MSQTQALIEASFADAIAIISASPELPEHKRRHWATSLRQIGRALDKPLEVTAARYSNVRADLAQLHEAPLGWTKHTLENHKSNAKAALLWLAKEKDVPRYGAPLTPAWKALRGEIADALVRSRLSSLMRYCSAKDIAPAELDEAVVDSFMEYRRQSGMPAIPAFRRLMARAWNSNVGVIAGWPERHLVVPPVKNQIQIPWTDFPEGLRRDVDRYLAGLDRIRKGRTGQRIRPLKDTTITARRRELTAAARIAVKSGVPIEMLISLAALLAPEVAEKILDALWRKNGKEPKTFTINLACRFLAIAKETKCLDDDACDRLDEMRHSLEAYRREGITDKNMELILKVLTPGVWSRVVKLPLALMAEARACRASSPVRAAVSAQMAVAIAILCVAPVRLANLTAIRLGFNLVKPGGPESNYRLMFPDYDVKNRKRLDHPLETYVTKLIDEYVFDFRPALLRGSNDDWLFLGQQGGAKGKISFSGQITARIHKGTGLRMTVHQFRHAAGAIILMRRPGEYALVQQLLGHGSMQTTINAYIGLENLRASEIYGKLITELMDDTPDAE
jgi:integrase